MFLFPPKEACSIAVSTVVEWLATHQSADGSWDESEFTGTGFPKVFYLRYHYYPIYFPLMALARFSQAAACSRDVRERVA